MISANRMNVGIWLWIAVLLIGGLSAEAFGAGLTKTQRSELYRIFNKNDIAGMKHMLDAGLDVNADMGGGTTLLLKAANIGTADMVKLLIERGADVSRKLRNGENALMKALINSTHYQYIIPLLLNAGVDVNVVNQRNGYNPVWQATSRIKSGYPNEPGFRIMAMLLKKGADPNAEFISKNKKYDGLTPLMHFSQKGFVHVVDLLLNFKADKNAKTGDGKTAVDFAKAKHHRDVVDLLTKWDPSTANTAQYAALSQGSKTQTDPASIRKKCKGDPREPWCYQEAVEKLGEPALCEPILDYWPNAVGVHGWCYYRLALKSRNCKLCDAIKKQDIKRTCYRDACGRK